MFNSLLFSFILIISVIGICVVVIASLRKKQRIWVNGIIGVCCIVCVLVSAQYFRPISIDFSESTVVHYEVYWSGIEDNVKPQLDIQTQTIPQDFNVHNYRLSDWPLQGSPIGTAAIHLSVYLDNGIDYKLILTPEMPESSQLIIYDEYGIKEYYLSSQSAEYCMSILNIS